MKGFKQLLFVFALVLGVSSLNSCNKCEETGEVTFGEDKQYFTITYLDTAGVNYVTSIFNLSNVSVLMGDLYLHGYSYVPAPYIEDFSDGKIGPISYTSLAMKDGSVEQGGAKMGVPYSTSFLIKRDTYGWDTLQIDFVATADACKEYWGEISYYLNGDSLGTFQNEEIANLEIIIP